MTRLDRRYRRSRGFTLVELMIVVVIVATLSFVAGFAYKKYMATARKSEVVAVFAEIRAKEETYRAEFSSYYGTSGSDVSFYPALGSCPAGANEPCAKTWNPPPAQWLSLNLNPGKPQLYCGYVVVAGAANVAPAGSYGAASFNNQTPNTPWWYVVATCDNDGKGAPNAIFVTTSERDTVFEQNAQY